MQIDEATTLLQGLLGSSHWGEKQSTIHLSPYSKAPTLQEYGTISYDTISYDD